jgi:serine/threonine protein kinase
MFHDTPKLISSLIHMDPTVRLTAEEALEHPWFADPIVVPVHYRRRPRRMKAVVQFLFEKMSLCRKSKKDVKVLAFYQRTLRRPILTNPSSSTPHRRQESTGSTNRFYDIDDEKTKYRIIST